MTDNNPIFVRGLSRSGGTLMCTILDAHKNISMSYELYPNLLETETPVDIDQLAEKIGNSSNLREAQNYCPTDRFGIFVVRCERGGLNQVDFARLLKTLKLENNNLSDIQGRFRLIELCGLEKMKRQGKTTWGMKCVGDYEDYINTWPKVKFINMLRDGRDVLASQINSTGSKRSPAQVANAWVSTHERFEKLVIERPDQALMVQYESLVTDPEKVLHEICNFLDVDFDEAITHHHEQDLTVYNASHISKARVQSKIDTSKIGRWKQELTDEELATFMGIGEKALYHFGYL